MRGLCGKLQLDTPQAALQWLVPPAQSFRDDVRPTRIYLHGRVDAIRDQINRTPVPLAQLALAYERWGSAPSSFAERLSGDFILIVVLEASGETLFIRDPLGIEPFYYSTVDQTLRFGTELRNVHSGDERLNEGFIAEWLSVTMMTRSETIFSGVHRLPPGSLLRAIRGKVSVERYWYPERAPELKTQNSAELQQRFTFLLEQAVARRLSEGTAAAELSGGLDSSTVACLGKRINGLSKAFSLVFNQRECAEREHASVVAKHAGLEWHPIEAGDVSLESLRQYIREHHTLPLHPTSAVSLPMLAAMSASGCKIALSGQGGDDLLTGSTHYPAEQLVSGAWLDFINDARSGPDAPGVWRQLRKAMSILLRKSAARDLGCVSAELARSTKLAERLKLPEPPERWNDYCRRDLFAEICGGFLASSLEEQALVYGNCGLSGRHPFYDRDLYEFCLVLPEHERQSRRVGKQILRRAVKGLVPDSILAREDKAEFSHLLASVLAQADADGALKLPQLRRTNWVSAEIVSSLLDDYRHQLQQPDGRKASVLNRLWTLLALELFLQEMPRLSRSINGSDAPVRREDLQNVGI
ncbi:MAG TPA: asparagine synthase-related protein [Planctomycetota bacterium]|nr:asparagine synthase-related protein [Planctomycetota bacterium]